jgi:cystathionine gamma-synthase
MSEKKTASSTDAVHAGDARAKTFDAVVEPVVLSSTYTFADTREVLAFMDGTHPRPHREEYGRYGNPTTRAVELRVAALEAAEDALLFPSGMAAITTTLLALVHGGQHVVLFADCYRRTRQLVTDTLANLGITYTLLSAGDMEGLRTAIRPETRLVFAESPTNPHLRCLDLAALASVCKEHRHVRSVVDATFATPINTRPIDFGVDLVIQSATKYLSGHNDALAGAVSGSSGLVSLIRDTRSVLGTVCDPHAAFLVARGIKTLGIRVERQNATALAVARHIERHSAIERVYYPGLPSHSDHAVAARQMKGFGGVVSFVVVGGLRGACKLVDGLTAARLGPSFGGVESLVEPPAIMSYFELAPEGRASIGIEEGLVRLSVGVEETHDVLADLDRALHGVLS